MSRPPEQPVPRVDNDDRVATERGAPRLFASPATVVRGVVGRALYFIKTSAARYPWPALPLARLRGEGELLDENTDIVIESFPRSASSFAVAAFRLAQQPRVVRVAYQTHAPGHVIAAVRRQVPALVLIREPMDVVVSNLIRHPERGVNGVLGGYLRFYEPLVPRRGGVVVATFSEVVDGGFGSVIRRVNERFGTTFAEFEATEANVQRCLREIDEEWRRRRGRNRERLERIIPRPSKLREEMKRDLRRQYQVTASKRLRDRARDLYEELAG
jgi:hypothetical protein